MENKLIPGLVSVTFRGMTPEEIIKTVKKNGLRTIEWGSDVHVPAGDKAAAESVKRLSEENGILVASYGSYHGKGESGFFKFADSIASAEMIGAKNIRIWAGAKNSEDVSAAERLEYIAHARILADMAAEKNIDISFECHGGTLTNTADSAISLIEEIDRDNVFLYWQPLQSEDVQKNKAILRRFLPHLKNVHIYAWKGLERFPLEEHKKAWREYADIVRSDGKEHNMLLEFVKDDDPDQLMRDAETLLSICE